MTSTNFTHQRRLHLLDKHLHLVSNYYTFDPYRLSLYWRLSAKRQWHRLIFPTWRDLLWSSAVSIYLISIFTETMKHGFFFSVGLVLSGVSLYWVDVLLAAPGLAWLCSDKDNKPNPRVFRMGLTTMVFVVGAYWTLIKAVLQ